MSRVVYRVTKARYPVFDGTGAARNGGRWHSPGAPVVYCADSHAGALLEVLVHAGAAARDIGLHHCARAHLPHDVPVETVDPEHLPGWDAVDEAAARRYGDAWLAEGRTAVLVVPAATAKPFGRNVLLNPRHQDFGRVVREDPVPLEWDPRLFR